MIERFDLPVLLWINHAWSRPWADKLFIFVTEQRNFVLPGLAAAAWLLGKGGQRGRRLLVTLALGVALTDAVSSRLVKPLVARVRPCTAVAGLRLPYGDRGTLSFPSSHAVNIAGSAVIAGVEYPALSWAFAAFAALVGLSRVYLGLHYPTDVLAGFILGGLLGILVSVISRKFRARSEAPPIRAAVP